MADPEYRGAGWVDLQTPLLTMVDAAGRTRVWPAQWIGLVCSPVPGVVIGVPEFPDGPAAPGVYMRFAVNLPPAGCRVPRSMVALLAGAGRELLTQAGMELADGTLPGVRLVADWPLQFECLQGRSVQRAGLVLVRGEVAALHCHGELLPARRWADLCRAPIRALLSGRAACGEPGRDDRRLDREGTLQDNY